MREKVRIVVLFGFLLCLIGCDDYSEQVELSLDYAGRNRTELEKVLAHYKKSDRQKYKAACYLIANMRYHHSNDIVAYDKEHEDFFRDLDSLYYTYLDGLEFQEYRSNKSYEPYRKHIPEDVLQLPDGVREKKSRFDLHTISADYLIDNIDHSFDLWKNSPYLKNVDFDTFLETVLPYRTVDEHPAYMTSELNSIFAEKLRISDTTSLYSLIERYKSYTKGLRWLTQRAKPKERMGVYDVLMASYKNDCHNVSIWTCDIFRSFGIPMVYEYTPQWQDMANRHFWCSTIDEDGMWAPFTPPDNNLMEDWDGFLKYAGKVYRKTFAANPSTPYFLKDEHEYVPRELSSPCLSDQTFRYHQTVTLRLPFDQEMDGNLAYLCFFNPGGDNHAPVAWGRIDRVKKEVVFEQVPLNIIFFPVYYSDNETPIPFAAPFVLKSDEVIKDIPLPFTVNKPKKRKTRDMKVSDNELHYTKNSKPVDDIEFIPICPDGSVTDIIAQRKYPKKRRLNAMHEQLVGASILGGNNDLEYDTLYRIGTLPEPYLQEHAFANEMPYRYYKIAVDSLTSLNIAHIEFLGPDKSGNYSAPTPLPVLCPEQSADDTVLYKLDGIPLKTGSNPMAGFDGNMETYVGSSHLGMYFDDPVVVTRVRLVPRNANNGIVIGNSYELMYYDNGWHSVGRQVAEENYVLYEGIPANTVYWLHNLTAGKEELVFTYKNGKQHFINRDGFAYEKF